MAWQGNDKYKIKDNTNDNLPWLGLPLPAVDGLAWLALASLEPACLRLSWHGSVF
jgi:hypothetical protein